MARSDGSPPKAQGGGRTGGRTTARTPRGTAAEPESATAVSGPAARTARSRTGGAKPADPRPPADLRPPADPRPPAPDGPEASGDATRTGPGGPPGTGGIAAADAGEVTRSHQAALDALAQRRVPRSTPRPATEPLPTTRRGMLRYRVLPRSVLGIASLILALAIGAGFSGVVLYSYYQYKLNQADSRVNSLVSGYTGQFQKAEGNLNAAVSAAKNDINEQLKAAQALQAGPAQLATLVKMVAPSVFFVHTLDANGQPAVGTAFVISSNGSQSLLLTSYTTVAAATRSPGPPVYVQQGSQSTQVTVRSWDNQYDLALLILPKGGLTALTAAPTSPSPQPGDRLFAVSGLGSAGASVVQGNVVDVSSSGLAVDDAIGSAFQGGPIVNQSGQVIAVGSQTYAPLGFTSTGVYYTPYVEAACNKVLTCPGGSLVGSS